MKKTAKRISLAVLALLCAACFVLAGCGGGGAKVTFDYNYEGGGSVTYETEDGSVQYPSSPTRSGYMFTGWYLDPECTTSFDGSGIESDMTVYAGWRVHDDSKVYLTYDYNYNNLGTYTVEEYEYDEPIYNFPRLSRDGYMFDGWYYDAAGTQSLESPYYTSEDVTLYARWLCGYRFEAECTDLTKSNGTLRDFKGYSQTGEPVWADGSASGGYYIGDMYANELYLEFVIQSDKAVSDAALYMNVAMLFGWGTTSGTVEFTSNDYLVTVNGEAISYSSFSFDVSGLSQGDRTSFRDVYIGRVSLQQGENVIRLTVNNSEHGQGGSMDAKAPLVDYIQIYTDATLSWTEIDNRQYISSGGTYA